jgi:hypothetical protein
MIDGIFAMPVRTDNVFFSIPSLMGMSLYIRASDGVAECLLMINDKLLAPACIMSDLHSCDCAATAA